MKAWLSSSGGKDSMLALERARVRSDIEITALLTTLSEEFDRVSMHGLRRTLLEAQAKSLQLPVEQLFLPTPPSSPAGAVDRQPGAFTVFASNQSYEERMLAAFGRARAAGVDAIVFGDIFLEDLRAYRQRLLAQAGLQGIFPLWGEDSRELAEEVIARKFQAVVICVDGQRLERSHCGRSLDQDFLDSLPAGCDPCGERGEYHSFVHNGPGFRDPVKFTRGDCILREPFWFCDLELSTPENATGPV